MKKSLILVTVTSLLFALSSVAFGQSTPVKKKAGAKVAKPTNSIKKNTTTQKPLINQTSGSGDANGVEMTPCDVQGNNSGSNKTANAQGKNQKPTANGITSPAGTWECAKANEENTQRSAKTHNTNAKTTGSASVTPKKNAKKTTNFQTTSEDFQSVKKAKTQSGVNDPGDWSSKTKVKTTPKSSNAKLRKTKTNGVYEEDEQKTPKKKKTKGNIMVIHEGNELKTPKKKP